MLSVLVALLNEKSASAEIDTPVWDVPLPLDAKVQSPRPIEGVNHTATAVSISSLIARTRLNVDFQKLLNISAPFPLLSIFLKTKKNDDQFRWPSMILRQGTMQLVRSHFARSCEPRPSRAILMP
jgi:hypothetical protein